MLRVTSEDISWKVIYNINLKLCILFDLATLVTTSRLMLFIIMNLNIKSLRRGGKQFGKHMLYLHIVRALRVASTSNVFQRAMYNVIL